MTQSPTIASTSLTTTNNTSQPKYIITDDDKARIKIIQDAWTAYHGQLDPPLQKMDNQPDDNVLSNECMPVVHRGRDFLFGKPVGIALATPTVDTPTEPKTTTKNSVQVASQKLLDDTWGTNEVRLPLLQKLATSGAVAGQAFLRIVPSVNKTYRLIVVDPATVYVQTDVQDCETVELYCIEYSRVQQVNNKPAQVYYREEIERVDPDHDGDDGDPFADVDASWIINHWTRIGERGNWQAVGSPIVWDYTFPPIFSSQNLDEPHSFWGMSDIPPDYIQMNKALNLVLSCINRTSKLYSTPIIYATGVAESYIDFKPGRIIGLPTDQSKITAVNYTSDLANMLLFANDLRGTMNMMSSVPDPILRGGTLPRGQLSGVALELLFMPLIQKTEKKRCLYGKLLIDVSIALLVLAGYSENHVTLQWQNMLPNDDLQSAQTAIAKKSVGVSEQTVLEELGYNADIEMERSREEYAEQLVNASRGQGLPPLAYSQPGQALQPGQTQSGGGDNSGGQQ